MLSYATGSSLAQGSFPNWWLPFLFSPHPPRPPTAIPILSAVASLRKKKKERNRTLKVFLGRVPLHSEQQQRTSASLWVETELQFRKCHSAWNSLPWPGMNKDIHGHPASPPLCPTDTQDLKRQNPVHTTAISEAETPPTHMTRWTCKLQTQAHGMKAQVYKQPMFHSINRTARNRIS